MNASRRQTGFRRRPIVLLGCQGQVGYELQRALAPLAAIAALGRRECDLVDPDAIRRAVRDAAPSIVVNAAAYTAVDQAESETDLAMRVNGFAPGVLAEECRRTDSLLVHFSTDYVFNGVNPRRGGYVEADAPEPINTYGRSKLAGEQAIAAVAPVHLILRTGWVYAMRGRNFLRTIVRLAAERDRLTVVDDQWGAPTWARMLAEATAQILYAHWFTAETLRERGGLYHLSAGGRTTWCRFARAIIAAHGLSVAVDAVPTHGYPTAATRPPDTVLDTRRIRSTFGIRLPAWRHQLALCLEADGAIAARPPA